MTGDVMGGGVVVAVAAALWLAYLVPVWLRRREYLATERNAVRLQQTLRILAETSELPEQVRMEATARTVAEQQRILKRAEQKKLVEARATAAAHARREQAIAEEERRVAEEAEAAAADAIALERASRAAAAQRARVLAAVTAIPQLSPQRRRRLRRSRALSTLVLIAAVVGGVIGTVSLVATGAWPTLAVSAVVGVLAIGMLVRLAGTPHAAPAAVFVPAAAPLAHALYDDATHDVQESSRPRQESWTPRPLPKPLHLSRGTIAATAMASIDAATELRRSAALAEVERTVAERAVVERTVEERVPAPMPLRPVAALPAQEPSRYAAMGLVDDLGNNAIDLDAVLRRRRAAS